MSDFYVEQEENIVYLKEGSEKIGGINPRDINASPEDIITAFNTITNEYQLTQKAIKEIIQRVHTQGNIIGFERTLLMFCYFCKTILDNNGEGILSVVNSLKRSKDYKNILHDVFVVEIASEYADKNKIKINISKKEKGPDFCIDEFKCECKIRLGYLNSNQFLNEEKLLINLVRKEYRRLRDKVIEAFFKQGADIVFIDSKRTNLGIFLRLQSVSEPPELEKYSIILYSTNQAKSHWIKIFILP